MKATYHISAEELDKQLFSKYIFWSYKEDADIPVTRVVKQVISYGEISDLLTLAKLVPHNVIADIIKNWKEKERYKKRIYFFYKVFLSDVSSVQY